MEVTRGWDEMEVEGRKIGNEVVWVTNCKGIADKLREPGQAGTWKQRVMEGMTEQMRKYGRMGICAMEPTAATDEGEETEQGTSWSLEAWDNVSGKALDQKR